MYSAFGVSVAFCAILRVNSMAIDQNPNNLIKIVSNVFPSDVVANATSSLPMVGGAGNFQTRYPGGRWPDQAPNTGDMIYSARKPDDKLLVRDIFVPNTVEESRRDLFWKAIIPSAEVTQVRVLNFGDEKAFATKIQVKEDLVRAYFTVQSQTDPRVIFEVYGFVKDQ